MDRNDDPDDEFPDIDLTSALQYMSRNGVARMKFTIEAMDVQEDELAETRTSLAIMEMPADLVEDVMPERGLGGFLVFQEENDA